MKRIIVILQLLIPVLTIAQDKGLLWSIRGPEGQQSFLYGTIHIQQEEVFRYGTAVDSCLKLSDKFLPELILDSIQPMQMMMLMALPPDSTIAMALSEEEYAKANACALEKGGAELSAFPGVKPFFIMAQWMQKELPQDRPYPLDVYLLGKARELGLKTQALEKLEEQLDAIQSLSLRDQALMLSQFCDETEDDNMEDLVQKYLDGDLQAFAQMMKDPLFPEGFEEAFLTKRNHTMHDRILTYSQNEVCFFAVGAAHLSGPEGLIALLRKSGYRLEPIPFKFTGKP